MSRNSPGLLCKRAGEPYRQRVELIAVAGWRYKRDMIRTAVLCTIALWWGPGLGNAQTGVKSPNFSKVLADYSTAMEDLAQSASPAVVQILVQTLAPLGNGDSQRAGFVSEREATGSGGVFLL